MLGIADRVLGLWANESWFPADGKTAGGWNVPAIRQARDAMSRKGSEQSDRAKQLKQGLDAEKLKKATLERKQRELNLREQEGKLLPRAGWELFAAQLLTQLGDWCDQLPNLLAADVPRKYRKKVRERAKKELDLKRRELRDELERKAKELDQETAE